MELIFRGEPKEIAEIVRQIQFRPQQHSSNGVEYLELKVNRRGVSFNGFHYYAPELLISCFGRPALCRINGESVAALIEGHWVPLTRE